MRALDMEVSRVCAQEEERRALDEAVSLGWNRLHSGKEPHTAWVNLPARRDDEELARMRNAAQRIGRLCDALVVIGIGGSYLGTRAAYELIRGCFAAERASVQAHPALYFAGHNLSASYHRELLEVLRDRDIAVCVVSKSGQTLEPSVAFSLFKEELVRRYGRQGVAERIVTVTDAQSGSLRAETLEEGYESFAIPRDVGGRYSFLTPAGLLPLAIAGHDPEAFLDGALRAMEDEELMRQAGEYALLRNVLYGRGKVLELFQAYEPRFASFIKWLKQLFGESEGKQGRGIFPAGLLFTTDLHSLEQFLQEGTPCFFETLLDSLPKEPGILHDEEDLRIPEESAAPWAGRSLAELNRKATESVTEAHAQAGIPMFRLRIFEKITPQTVGQMVYFFETACALSAYAAGVNPFDQPGVEAYKRRLWGGL